MAMKYKPSDRLGIQRTISPKGFLPQQAESLDTSLPIAEDEVLIDVESLNIDSASFHQIAEVCGGDENKISQHITDLVAKRGKQHNPVTGSGGMLIGRVKEVGPLFPVNEKPIQVGDRIATLVSLSLTPLAIRKTVKIFPKIDRVDIEGYAILFASGLFARLPKDLPEAMSLAVLDVAGAPAQTEKLVKANDVVVVIGGAGKSGVLCLYQAKQKPGVVTIAIDYSNEAMKRLDRFNFVDYKVQLDARKATDVYEIVKKLTHGKMADVVINVANIPDTEMSCILAAKKNAIVYYFSMATSFTKAALGAEGVGADIDLRIGNGYTEGHADLSLDILRKSPEIYKLFEEAYVNGTP